MPGLIVLVLMAGTFTTKTRLVEVSGPEDVRAGKGRPLATRPAEAKKPKAKPKAQPAISKKIELDLTKLDKNGMRGPQTGKVLVAYEFCIPNTAKCKAQVKAIDKSVRFMPGSRGRIGARKDQCLCIGETGPNYRTVLNKLAALPYVKRIIECHWE